MPGCAKISLMLVVRSPELTSLTPCRNETYKRHHIFPKGPPTNPGNVVFAPLFTDPLEKIEPRDTNFLIVALVTLVMEIVARKSSRSSPELSILVSIFLADQQTV